MSDIVTSAVNGQDESNHEEKVEIDDDTIRTLSARKANRYERKRFQKEIKNRLG